MAGDSALRLKESGALRQAEIVKIRSPPNAVPVFIFTQFAKMTQRKTQYDDKTP